jgi:hypothetical protein
MVQSIPPLNRMASRVWPLERISVAVKQVLSLDSLSRRDVPHSQIDASIQTLEKLMHTFLNVPRFLIQRGRWRGIELWDFSIDGAGRSLATVSP